MAWALTIHKSQRLTLEHATIDIGKKKQQGLTFTFTSRVNSIDGLRISPPFSFERYGKMKNRRNNFFPQKDDPKNKYTQIEKKINLAQSFYPE